jgi:putative glycosyltransferase
MRLSVVSTLFRSEATLLAFLARVHAAAGGLTEDYEVVLVNDGSPDRSLEIAIAAQAGDARLRVIDLSRNFGHHKAMMTGLAHARGELVFLLDSDLEEDPALLSNFHAEMTRTRADVVFGVQESRKGGLVERISGALYFRLFNLLSDVPIPTNLTTIRLMTRRYVNGLVSHREREMMIAGLWVLTGFHQVPVSIDKGSRPESTYDLARKAGLLADAVTSFSDRPLFFLFWLGLGLSSASALAAFGYFVRRVFFGPMAAGWPSLFISIWFLGGLTLFALGLIGIYLAKIFVETKQRPYTIVRAYYGFAEGEGGGEQGR